MSLQPSQRAAELAAFVQVLTARGVRSYLEIGARYGQTFEAVGLALAVPSVLVAVEQPGAQWGRNDSWPVLLEVADRLRAHGHAVHIVKGDSHARETLEAVLAIRPQYDAVFIDADHTEQAVRQDWADYGSLGTVVGFHDIAPEPHNVRIEVPRVWNEIAAQYPVLEFIDPSAPGMGIGVAFRDGST